MRRLITLGACFVLMALGGTAPAFAQSEADQTADNAGDSQASNGASTTQQGGEQSQSASSSCVAGCGGVGQYQESNQTDNVHQNAPNDANQIQHDQSSSIVVSIDRIS